MEAPGNLSGLRFGMLLAVSRIAEPYKKTKYLCKCDCGNITTVTSSNLVTGHTKSCGCLTKKHGLAKKERLYNIWIGMRQRCRDVNSQDYMAYGGRGIHVCHGWENDYAIFRQWAVANGYDDSLSIDRINNDSGYSPENCRWASSWEQNNNLRSNVLVEFNGDTHTLAEWSRVFGIPYSTLISRRKRGWSFARIAENGGRNG